jgi:hypothetical protein
MICFFNVLRSQDNLGIAESWAGLETCKVNGYTSYFKGRCKYGRYPGGLAVYIKDNISKHVKNILAIMREILYV